MKVTRRTFLHTAGTAGIALNFPLLAGSGRVTGPLPLPEHPICFFSKHLQYCDVKEMSEILAQTGFDGIDLTVRPGGHVEPGKAERDLPRAVKAAESAGLKIPMITTNITDPEDKISHQVLQTASESGVAYYRMGSLKYDFSMGIEQNLDAFRKIFEKFQSLNMKYGIHGDYQNHWGTGFGAPIWDLYSVLKGLDPAWVGCQYDIRHAVVEGGASWSLGLRTIGTYIHSSVIKDFLWTKDSGKWRPRSVPLGTGMVDFEAYFKEFEQLENTGPISLHYEYGLGNAKERNEESRTNDLIVDFYQKDLNALKKKLSDAGLR